MNQLSRISRDLISDLFKDLSAQSQIIMSERYFGYVSRTITLPADVKQSEVDAHYKDGILLLAIPKADGQVNNRISIN